MYDRSTDSKQFHQFYMQRMSNGEPEVSPEELVDEYRMIYPLSEDDDDLAAVQEALDDIAAGDRGTPLDEFEKECRERYGVPRQP